MDSITVYSTYTSARLVYVLDWLLVETLQLKYRVVSDLKAVDTGKIFISYGKNLPQAISIPDCGLLNETGIKEQEVTISNWNSVPILFPNCGDYTLPFDIFSAIFFLLSRYEEYYAFNPDKHGRYPATQSVLYQHQLLERPVVDEWVLEFYPLLRAQGVAATPKSFSYRPSYDIDIAFSFRHKSMVRTAGAFAKDLVKGRYANVSERLDVLLHRKADPYDCFSWLKETHQQFGWRPLYFMLVSLRTTDFDKNIAPLHPAMQQLISDLVADGDIGLHPSYYSSKQAVFQEEKSVLEKISGQKILHSRQHYVRMTLPDTYRKLMLHGISEDWSMGYGAHLGFRAGTGRTFFWYDLENEQQTALRIHPFCFMDSTARFEEGLSAEAAFKRLDMMKQHLLRTSSSLVTVFHNFSLGNEAGWEGWRDQYFSFLKELSATVKALP